ncbi:MAG: InlB B-repeat-containing protein [Clostridiales bacterium]|nr:InlB B-repeat-containing protein [Clostridiales bacterium]
MKTFNKNLFIKILCISLFVLTFIGAIVFLVVKTKRPDDTTPKIDYVAVQYSIDSEKCGTLKGNTHQYFEKGGNATKITVVPNIGYMFLGWEELKSAPGVYVDADKFTRRETNVQSDMWFVARFRGPVESRVIFIAGKGGTVEGELEQTVLYGAAGKTVTAIPDNGYRFVRWSDGETEAIRENSSLCHYGFSSPYIEAEFERYSRTFEYICNDGILATEKTQIEINLDNINSITLPVPKRQNCRFAGWYSDWHYTIQIADKNGLLVVDKDWISKDYYYSPYNREGYLYAKWEPLAELPTYRVLMVFVTEVHGDFIAGNNIKPETLNNVRVDYVMSETEKKVANKLVGYFGDYLNAILNAKVNFEVDLFFTTQPWTKNNFIKGSDGGVIRYSPYEKLMPEEVLNLVEGYDSVITTFCLCGYENGYVLTGNTAGTGRAKFAEVTWEGVTDIGTSEGTPFEKLLDPNDPNTFWCWEANIETYIHEFIHTVEGQMGELGLLHVLLQYHFENFQNTSSFDLMRQYLGGYYIKDGENVGIPYEFWESKNRKNKKITNF